MNAETLKVYEEYCLDHFKNFGAIPVEWEYKNKVYDMNECWEAWEKLNFFQKK